MEVPSVDLPRGCRREIKGPGGTLFCLPSHSLSCSPSLGVSVSYSSAQGSIMYET